MGKFWAVFWDIVFLLALMPAIKGFYDYFLAPTTGLYVIAGTLDDNSLALWYALPWLVPLGVGVKLMIDLVKPDTGESIGSSMQQKIRMPQQPRPAKQKKEQKPPAPPILFGK